MWLACLISSGDEENIHPREKDKTYRSSASSLTVRNGCGGGERGQGQDDGREECGGVHCDGRLDYCRTGLCYSVTIGWITAKSAVR